MSNTGGREEVLDELEDNTMNNKGDTEGDGVGNESDTMNSNGVNKENGYGHEFDMENNKQWKEEVRGGGGGGGEGSAPDDLYWVTTFEDLLKLVGTKGPWNVMIFFLCAYASFISMSYQFLGATPDHWCLVPVLVEANWTQQQILSIAIPYNNVTGEYDSCQMYDYDYTTVAEMGYEEAREGLLTPTNLTVSCWSRDFNYTQYQSTVVTEWDLVCERKALYSTTQAVLGIGTMASCLVYGILIDRLFPESPRWLIQKGRHSQALTILKKAAKMNKRSLPQDTLMLQAMEQITSQKEIDADKSIWAEIKASLPDIRIFRRRVSLIFVIWFFGAIGYFGVSLNATNIKVDIYLYIFLSGLLEIPSYLLLWPAISYFGRKKIHSSLYLISGVCILFLMALLLLEVGNDVLLLTISLCGKIFITAVYQLTWVCTTELFPTIHRSQALGCGLFMANFAFISIPYVNDILGDLVVWAPSAVLGCASMAAGLIACLLPETRDNYMPEILGATKNPSTQTKFVVFVQNVVCFDPFHFVLQEGRSNTAGAGKSLGSN
ncbi:hypothetical protein Pcinc_030758 [Petrolisthes cinctipes]|uniref:Organic cation transporter 1 n=1 Tax=Petrolisthes cinctipes TaxID=88211 RepID=A0AAE1EY50_PETCI|nr:hypothetical protein Pcinc_030758 [Petrolisthes cinctipes]